MVDYEFRGVRRRPDADYNGKKWNEHPFVGDMLLYCRLRSDSGLPLNDMRNDPNPAQFQSVVASRSELHLFALIVREERDVAIHMWDSGVACRTMVPHLGSVRHPTYPMDVFGRVVDLANLADQAAVLAWTEDFRAALEQAFGISTQSLPPAT